jgi:predicted ATPase/class 3 adenylate cyclase
MRCSKCGVENPARAKFCVECASPFVRRCPSCNAENPQTAKFCLECAKPLEGAGGKSQRVLDAGPPIKVNTGTAASHEGERKTVTVLFADIKGSMELIEDLDPEEARAIVDPALRLMIDAVHHYDGYIAQSTGDGIFALFGAPVAHEDHPQRALFAALRMQDQVKRYAEELRAEKGVNLQVRVGANTGEVVVREIRTGEKHTEYVPIGHSTSVAARLQALAAPGSIAISESVRKLVEGYFALKPLGPARIKGVSEPLEIYEVTGLGPLRTRLQRAAARGYTKFVGRQREMETMEHAADLAKLGHGQIVAAVAEAGVGKSRLFHEFKARNQFGWMVLDAFSVSHGRATAYLPAIELLHGYFRITSDDDQRTRREKVNGRIVTLDPMLEDTRPYLFGLLGFVEGDDPLGRMDAKIRRRRTQDAIKRILQRESLNQPLMVIFEDLHQIDDETQALLNLLADSIGTSRILLLVNYRPVYSHPWGGKTYYTQLRVDPLGRENADEMLSTLLGSDESVTPPKRLIAEKAEGNPLFIEEIYQALIEEGVLVRNGAVKITRSLSHLKIPATVQAILAARIDRLPAEQKDLLETAAVIGKDFRLGVIGKVVAGPHEDLERTLAQLQLAEFIYEQPTAGDIEYTFKHQLTHEVAYNSVLVERRKALHERVAHAIEELGANNLDGHLADLAHHYGRSGNRSKAVEYLQLAAQQAAQRSVSNEAIDQLKNALRILKSLPETTQRDHQELILQTMLGPLLIATKGNAADEVGVTYKRAVELSRRVADNAGLFPVLFGMRSFHLVRAELRRARELDEQLLGLAEKIGDAGLSLEAHLAHGNTLLISGEFKCGIESMESALSLYDPQKHRVHAFSYGLEPGVFCLVKIGWIFAVLGRWDQAARKIAEALALAHQQSHLYSLAVAIANACNFHALRRDWPALQRQAEAGFVLCNEHGFANLLEQSKSYREYATVQQGQTDTIAQMREALAGYLATGTALGHAHFLSYLADACGTAAKFEEGLAAVAEALALAESTGERDFEAWLYELKGDLVLNCVDARRFRSSIQQQAEECFRRSLEIARRQGAKSFELRTATSLARLLRDTNRRDEARAMLAEIYNWFTEGFDTADLKDAKILIDELNN